MLSKTLCSSFDLFSYIDYITENEKKEAECWLIIVYYFVFYKGL